MSIAQFTPVNISGTSHLGRLALGQTPEMSILPIDGNTGDILKQKYATLRNKCIENYGADFCNAVLPQNLVYAVTRRRDAGKSALPWWGWILIGWVLSKIVRL